MKNQIKKLCGTTLMLKKEILLPLSKMSAFLVTKRKEETVGGEGIREDMVEVEKEDLIKRKDHPGRKLRMLQREIQWLGKVIRSNVLCVTLSTT